MLNLRSRRKIKEFVFQSTFNDVNLISISDPSLVLVTKYIIHVSSDINAFKMFIMIEFVLTYVSSSCTD